MKKEKKIFKKFLNKNIKHIEPGFIDILNIEDGTKKSLDIIKDFDYLYEKRKILVIQYCGHGCFTIKNISGVEHDFRFILNDVFEFIKLHYYQDEYEPNRYYWAILLLLGFVIYSFILCVSNLAILLLLSYVIYLYFGVYLNSHNT